MTDAYREAESRFRQAEELEDELDERGLPPGGTRDAGEHAGEARVPRAPAPSPSEPAGDDDRSDEADAAVLHVVGWRSFDPPSGLRRRWDRRSGELATRSHEVIRAWARIRDALPAILESPSRPSTRGLGFLFGADAAGGLPIPWADWLASFDVHRLVFVFREVDADARLSSAYRLNSPHRRA